jgi:hypothetical protein
MLSKLANVSVYAIKGTRTLKRKLSRADLAVRKRLFKVLEQCVALRREQIRRMKLQTEFGIKY